MLSVSTAAWRGTREALRLLGGQRLSLGRRDRVDGWCSRCCPCWGRRSSWSFSPLQGQEEGHWRCLSITYWGMFSEGRGWEFLFAVAVGKEELLFWFFFFCLIWVFQDPVSKAPGAELFFFFKEWQVG